MITESTLAQNNTAATVNEVTVDVSQAVVPDNAVKAEDYKDWLEKAADVCGSPMKGDIDPVHKQSENIAPLADAELANQLGLEDLTEINSLIGEEDEAELNKLDEESRQYDFTAEDVGICNSSGSYSPALEKAWVNLERFKDNVERLCVHDQEAEEIILGLESAGVIDYDTANKIKERIPGSLDKVNIKMFTKLPSKIGFKVAHEGTVAGKIIIGGLIIAGSIYLIYKILSWTIDGIKAISKIIKRMRERRRNYKRTYEKVAEETFNPEDIDLEKMAKALFNEPTTGVKAKMKATGRQPAELREIKWSDTKDFANLITPIIQRHLDDIDGTNIGLFNERLENLVEKVHESVIFAHEILEGINATSGSDLNASIINQALNDQLVFANEFINEVGITITFSNKSNVERLKAVYEWLDEGIKPIFGYTLNKAPSVKMISSMGDVHFNLLDDKFADQISIIRETLNPKGKKTIVESDTLDQAQVRKEIIKDITVTFMALSNVIRAIYHYTLYVESVIIAEDQFINKVKKFTTPA